MEENPDFSKKEQHWFYTWKDTRNLKVSKYKNTNYSNHYIVSHPELKLRRLQRHLTNYFGGG